MVELRLPGLPDDLVGMRYREMTRVRKSLVQRLYNVVAWLERWPSQDERNELRRQYEEYAGSVSRYVAQVVDGLPFETSTSHAFTPRETAMHGGSEHVVLLDDVSVGRLVRSKGDALCRPAKRFWGLELVGDRLPDCVACVERAESIVGVVSRTV